ncbi:uncharacterized protein C11orf97 homolog isoform X1 [Chelonia mydas]|uniref:uncharacterized protein C11orf97 homolog isoform X1 n=1 Tax=Chelonia mydas TaxID=8469 RepID=UPI001CA863FF|nr:uncharacterized protein C11orf97 homolog isoform X1 [Chelonia mydas]
MGEGKTRCGRAAREEGLLQSCRAATEEKKWRSAVRQRSSCCAPPGILWLTPWGKKFVYVEPPKRVKEVLEEELYFRRDGCQIKHPAAVALEGIWSLKRNFSVGGFKPTSQNRNSLLSQPKYYSRHGGIRR